ncbi:hypothetical protein OH77DRAFT_676843 [Trametes cingulata]|nr:hypothetical protein OH77DRAFT_676843 [Trametes cingulata]
MQNFVKSATMACMCSSFVSLSEAYTAGGKVPPICFTIRRGEEQDHGGTWSIANGTMSRGEIRPARTLGLSRSILPSEALAAPTVPRVLAALYRN